MKILALGGSIRSNPQSLNLLLDLVAKSDSLASYKQHAADFIATYDKKSKNILKHCKKFSRSPLEVT